MLRLEAEAGAVAVDAAALAGDGAVQVVPRIELDAGLGGLDLERATREGLDDPGDERGIRVRAAEDVGVVVAAPGRQLRMVRANAGSDGLRRPEVERRASTAATSPVGMPVGSVGA